MIDEVCTAKEGNLHHLQQELKDLTRERDQLKQLNIKLMARTEKLQNIIDEEASAHVFYYDYPPKADPELSGDAKGGVTSETDKAKKLFEDQINTLKRNYEREYNDMITTFAAEHEEMQGLLSSVTRECVEIKDKYVELDVKFKEYYMRSDHYIKQQATDLQQVKTELQQL